MRLKSNSSIDVGAPMPTLRLCLAGIAVVLTLTACGRPPEFIGIDNERVPAATVAEATRHKVFIATSRSPSSEPGQFYSRRRSDTLGLSSVVVSVPPTHQISKLERPKNLPPDPRRQFAVVDPVVYGSDSDFLASLNRELSKRAPSDRSILVFIHGYNNNLSDAVARMGQFVEDSGFSGVPVLFSWASFGSQWEYVYDVNSALLARVLMNDTADLLSRANANRIDVLAWSMGSLAIMEGIVYASATGRFDRADRLKNIILASPDIDLDLFRAQLKLAPQEIANIYVLASKGDRALGLSRWLAGGQTRLGQADLAELEGLGVSVIDLSDIDDVGSKNHGKFAKSPSIVQLIGRGLQKTDTLDVALIERPNVLPTLIER